jgi:hypothetical protein
MLAAMIEFQTEEFSIDAAYTMHCTVKLPPAIPLPGHIQPVPHLFVADDAFAMRNYIMKPYPFKNNQHLTEYSITGYPEHEE